MLKQNELQEKIDNLTDAEKEQLCEDNPDIVCPITHQIMSDPVKEPAGRSYERNAIIDWISRSNTSPFTRAPLNPDMLTPNDDLKKIIGDIIDETISKRTALPLPDETHCTSTVTTTTQSYSPFAGATAPPRPDETHCTSTVTTTQSDPQFNAFWKFQIVNAAFDCAQYIFVDDPRKEIKRTIQEIQAIFKCFLSNITDTICVHSLAKKTISLLQQYNGPGESSIVNITQAINSNPPTWADFFIVHDYTQYITALQEQERQQLAQAQTRNMSLAHRLAAPFWKKNDPNSQVSARPQYKSPLPPTQEERVMLAQDMYKDYSQTLHNPANR